MVLRGRVFREEKDSPWKAEIGGLELRMKDKDWKAATEKLRKELLEIASFDWELKLPDEGTEGTIYFETDDEWSAAHLINGMKMKRLQ